MDLYEYIQYIGISTGEGPERGVEKIWKERKQDKYQYLPSIHRFDIDRSIVRHYENKHVSIPDVDTILLDRIVDSTGLGQCHVSTLNNRMLALNT